MRTMEDHLKDCESLETAKNKSSKAYNEVLRENAACLCLSYYSYQQKKE